ncbi:MAG: hypothetical protein L3J84_00930 [Gammaproteobacteria bacterium]|nr:hypothetical protein [Gammaproteobacteria bacterium]
MITIGSISRLEATNIYPFLAKKYRGRRKAIKEFTHRDPDFVFWIYPDGRLFDARDAHKKNIPKGYGHIVNDEPNYGGFLRGRVATLGDHQLIVVYCLEETLSSNQEKIEQFLTGVSEIPVPIMDDALVISDNADIFGTITDIHDSIND